MIPILGNLFTPQDIKGQNRHAESSDTRQEIQRHDPDQQRRSKNKRDQEEDEFQDDSIGMIAVEALSLFLRNFLKSLEDNKDEGNSEDKPAPRAQAPQTSQTDALRTSSRAAMAAHAYRHVAQAGQKTSLLGDNKREAPAIKLDASDVRAIHDVLEDLKTLQDKHIEYVHIERDESFLQSIITAVNAAKNSQSFEF